VADGNALGYPKRHSNRMPSLLPRATFLKYNPARMTAEPQTQEADRNAGPQSRPSTPTFRLTLPFSERRALLILGDTMLINGAVLAALWLWAQVAGRPFTADFLKTRWPWFPFLTAAWWPLAALGDLYDIRFAGHRVKVVWRVVLVTLVLGVGYLVVFFLSPRNALPRLFFLFFAAITLVGMSLWRWTYAAVFTLPVLCRRILVAGAGWAGRTLVQALSEQDTADFQMVGFVDDDPTKQNTKVAGHPVLGSSDDLVDLVQKHRVDEVVLAVTHEMRGALFQALMDCQAMGVQVIHMPDLYERLTRRVPVEHVHEDWVLDALTGFYPFGHPERAAKRLLDLACGLAGAVGLGLLLPFVALSIRMDDRGPVFYSQPRAGLGGRTFRIIKFRTMRSDAEQDGNPRWAQRRDARVTRVGRLLRKTRLDELPQVINVLRGEMSIVGPRPERPEFITDLEKEIPFYRARLAVKPGLTGWAQIHYGYGSSVQDALIKLQYDLYYIRHRTIWLDLYVISRTIVVVMRGRGM